MIVMIGGVQRKQWDHGITWFGCLRHFTFLGFIWDLGIIMGLSFFRWVVGRLVREIDLSLQMRIIIRVEQHQHGGPFPRLYREYGDTFARKNFSGIPKGEIHFGFHVVRFVLYSSCWGVV